MIVNYKSRITLITSLKQKKYRFQHQLFVVEGIKTIKEFLNSPYELEHLYAMNRFEGISESTQTIVSEVELKKVSFFKNSNSALAVFKMKPVQEIDDSKLLVGLDNVRDPGNLGTIIRTLSWFSGYELWLSKGSVDPYNSKVIRSTNISEKNNSTFSFIRKNKDDNIKTGNISLFILWIFVVSPKSYFSHKKHNDFENSLLFPAET